MFPEITSVYWIKDVDLLHYYAEDEDDFYSTHWLHLYMKKKY